MDAIRDLLNKQSPTSPTSSDGDEDQEDQGHGDHEDQHEMDFGDQDGDQEDQIDEISPIEPPKTLTEAAEQLGIEPGDLYKLTVTTGDGEQVKIGDLKDAYQSRKEAERETAKRAADLDQRESAIVQEQRLWGELGDELNRALSPQAKAQLAQRLAAREHEERRKMVRAMPELADATKLDQFRTEVVEAMQEYGFSPQELVIGDHRQLLVIRDLMRLKKRLKALQDYRPEKQVPKSNRSQGRGNGKGNKAQIINRGRTGSEADKVAAVRSLLSGG